MTPLELNGVTLGQKHEHYNYLVKIATVDKTLTLKSINYDAEDIDNLFMIDVACARRDAQYVLEVLKGSDMLYVSRALRRSTWLLCDDQYAHIINPHYLHQQLFPEMTNKATNKLLLAIRLHLKNESRLDEFYNFYKDDFKTAQKWLPNCSEALIISVLKEDGKNINLNIMKRLCEKSLTILKICCERKPSECWFKSAKTFLFTDTERYLEILESVDAFFIPKFGKKATRFLMNRCPEIICDRFYIYCYKIDISEFGKHLKVEEIQPFLKKQLQCDTDAVKSWCKYKYVKHIILRIPEEQRFQLVQELFLNNTTSYNNTISEETEETIEEAHSWYRFAPFEIAFNAIKDKIFDETCTVISNVGVMNILDCPFTFPDTIIRPWALEVLVKCARDNLQHLQTLMSNYHGEADDKNVFDECISSNLLKFTKIHKYDETTWKMLNDMFQNMGIYNDVNKNKKFDLNNRYVPAIVIYNVLNDQSIPKVIEDYIVLDNFTKYRQKLDPDASYKLFEYLSRYASEQLISKEVKNKNEFAAVVSLCDEMIRFIKDWNKNVTEFPFLLNKIRELIKIKKETSWGNDVSKMLIDLYRQHKNIRKLLFEDSLVLYPSDETCLNILKHDPNLLFGLKNDSEAIIWKDKLSLRRTLRKIRVYFPNSIAKQWIDCFFVRLQQATDHKSCIEGLFILLHHKDALKLVMSYTPDVIETNWKEEMSTIPFNIKKNIAKLLYLLRPAVSLETVLLYTKDGYFQFAAPSLYISFLDTRSDRALPYIHKFLTEYGSLQKLGILYLLNYFDINEIKKIVLNVWNLKNSYSVRCGLFKYTYKLLVKEKEYRMILKIWELLDEIMCNLTNEFYASIKVKTAKISKIPKIVKYKFYRKAIIYMKTHPRTLEINYLINDFWIDLRFDVHNVEGSFIEELLLEAVDKCFIEDTDNEYYYFRKDILRLLTTYLTMNDSIDMQQIKFHKLFVPTMESFLTVWQEHKNLFKKVLESLSLNISKRLLYEKNYMVPVHLYKRIQTFLWDSFAMKKEYNLITFWNITVIFIELLETFSKGDIFQSIVDNARKTGDYYWKYQYECPEFVNVYSHIAPAFGKAWTNYLKHDLITTYPSVWSITSKSMMDALISLSFPYAIINQTLKHMLLGEDAVDITGCYQVAVGVIRFMFMNSGNGEYKFCFDEDLEKIILSHPSNIIRMHYGQCKVPFSEVYEEDENSNWRRAGLMPEGGPNDRYKY